MYSQVGSLATVTLPERKTCVTCKIDKPLSEFGSHKGKPGGKHYTCRSCWSARRYSDGNTCGQCGVPIINGASYCRKHCGVKGSRNTQYKNGRHVRKRDGYVTLSGHQEHPNADRRGEILEHVKVMGDHLGRPLIKGETVHHKNGNRADNRLSNLELWSTKQPKGQRVSDKIQYALEIIALYGSDPDSYAP